MAAILAEHGAGAVPWGKNTWHNFAHWEHLHNGSTLHKGGWPFERADGRAAFSPDDLPATRDLLARCLSWQIMLNWDEAKLQHMTEAVNHVVSAF
jgi:8-amino-3,8-dideoxy-alpha-D-manno-octulosonate transaminase